MKLIINFLLLIFYESSISLAMKLLGSPYFNRDILQQFTHNITIKNFSSFPESLPVDNPNNSTSFIRFTWVMRNFNLTSVECKEVSSNIFKGFSFGGY